MTQLDSQSSSGWHRRGYGAMGRKERKEAVYGTVAEQKKAVLILFISYNSTGVPLMKDKPNGSNIKQLDSSARKEKPEHAALKLKQMLMRVRPVRCQILQPIQGRLDPLMSLAGAYMETQHAEGSSANQVLLLGDGGEWVKNLGDTHFPALLVSLTSIMPGSMSPMSPNSSLGIMTSRLAIIDLVGGRISIWSS